MNTAVHYQRDGELARIVQDDRDAQPYRLLFADQVPTIAR